MSDASSGSGRTFRPMNVLLLAVPVILAGVGYLLYERSAASKQMNENRINRLQAYQDYQAKWGGKLQLDPRFTDANGDGIADAPKDTVFPDKLIFSTVASLDAEQEKETWADFMAHLSKTTGKPVEYLVTAKTASHQAEAFRDGKLHVTGFNTGAVPNAVNLLGFVPLVVPAREDGYSIRMEIIVAKTSPIQDLSGLRGKKFAVTNTASNSGFKCPLVTLTDMKLIPDNDYELTYSGGHRQSIERVIGLRYDANKKEMVPVPEYDRVDAAAVASDFLKGYLAEHKEAAEKIRVIKTSEQTFPPLCFGYAHNLDPKLATSIRSAFSSFSFDGNRTGDALKRRGQVKFVELNYKEAFQDVLSIDRKMLELASSAR